MLDFLEDTVDEKFFVRSERANALIQEIMQKEISSSAKGIDVVGDLWADNGHKSMAGRVYNPSGICPTLGASHFQQIKYILVKVGNVNPSGKGKNGVVVDSNGLARTITVEKGEGQKILVRNDGVYAIRKLTPKECFRLQGFADSDFEKLTCSNTQLYKQAGNSITVDVAEELLCMMFDEDGNFFV